MRIFVLLILSLISAVLYRIGGKGGFKNAKAIRRFGCAGVFLIAVWLLSGFKLTYLWAYILTYILSALALSTYHDYLAPDGKSENWLCWLVTGIVYGLSCFPLIWAGVNYYAIIDRAIALGLAIMLLRERTGKDWLEEAGSGSLYILSVPILLV